MGETFAERWARKERECGLEAVASEMVTCGGWVLPRDAAPCLIFDRAARPSPLWEVYASPSDWSATDRARLAPYRVIGSDGAGNPICVEQSSGAVWLLDHEDWFRTRQFVNSGVRQLAECLLSYMGEHDPERFRSAVGCIDPPALTEGSFWWHEATGLESA
jgi:SUKH-4 immunity protein